ncbi:MAG: U32 family peptidase [Oscillospiraceae bacterium]|nr:U32 family peptidase [Oscillospiraceae bacterium]
MLELLAPAGSMEALRAAVQNGANAVYLGSGAFNARQSAKNFTPQMLTEAVKYCHIRGVAVHLTLNTLVSDRELPQVEQLIRHAAASGVDAFIVQDLGVVRLCRQIAPHVQVHGSTQMTVHSLTGVQLCAALGMTRVVLSRELDREEIRYICQNSPIEIEVFAHGALCMCYSGQCYLSAAIGGRSGNRGRCAQPCRQSYGYGRYQNKYPLSLKDNCLVHYLKELEAMGVASIKLEGRMKRPEYVAAVTGVYRSAIDKGVVTEEMMDTLYAAFNRQGFTDGYYTGKIGKDMFGIREETKEAPRWCKEMRRTYEDGEAPLVPITMEAVVKTNKFTLTVTDPEGRSCTLEGQCPEEARVSPMTEEQLNARLRKTGGTPYYVTDVRIALERGLILPAAAINSLRRDVLNNLTALRGRVEEKRLFASRKVPMVTGPRHPQLTVQVTSREQITGRMLKMAPQVLYVPLHILAEDAAFTHALTERVRVAAVLPRIVHDDELPRLRKALESVRSLGVEEALVGNLGLVSVAGECGLRVRGDFSLNFYNSPALNAAAMMEMLSATVSPEMKLEQIRDVSKPLPCELLAYGRMPLMVTENCLIKGRTGECTCHLAPTKLTDKTVAEFSVIKDGASCRSVLLNGMKLYMLDRQGDMSKLGIWAYRVYFTTENPKEVDRILGACERPLPFDPGACTRGLYLRGVE